MTASADTDPLDAGSPETPPRSRAAVGPGGSRRRLAAVLRLVLAGSLVAALLGPLPLDEWAEQRPWLAESSLFRTVIGPVEQIHATLSFTRAYDRLRRQTRTLQALRFNASAGNQQ